MILDTIEKYTKDNKTWLIGDFSPSILKTDKFEIGIHEHKAHEKTYPHKHMLTKEINVILKGRVLINRNEELNEGCFFVFEEGEYSDVHFMEDTKLLVIRNGSFPSDKIMK